MTAKMYGILWIGDKAEIKVIDATEETKTKAELLADFLNPKGITID